MSDDLVKRPLDEVFDTMMEVQRNPQGAWEAIQEQADRIEALERERDAFLADIALKGGTSLAPTQDAYEAACRAIEKHRSCAEAAEAALAAMTAERDAKDHAFKVAVDRALQNGGLANATQARLAKAVEAVSNGLDQIDGMAAKHNPNSIWEMSRAIRATLAEIEGE